jgi:preprotein translocase subunit SecA
MQKCTNKKHNRRRSRKAGVVTIATNMAGRGTDIKLSAEVKLLVDLRL